MANFPIWKYGSGNTTLVLIHGGPSLSRYIDTLGKLLQDKFTIVEYQQRGTPEFPSESPNLNELLSDLKFVLDQCPQNRVLIGHSWGATLVNLYIRRNQEKAVFLSPAPLSDSDARAFANNLQARMPEAIRKKLDELQKLETNADREKLQQLKQKRLELISPYYHLNPASDAALAGLKWNFHSFSVLMDEAWSLIDKGELGPLSHVPVIQGEHDPIPTLPYATIVSRSGHFPWIENPKDFLKSLMEKLSV